MSNQDVGDVPTPPLGYADLLNQPVKVTKVPKASYGDLPKANDPDAEDLINQLHPTGGS